MTSSKLTASEIVHAINAREVSASEVLQAAISTIEKRERHIDALLTKSFESAEKAASRIDAALRAGEELGPLCGVPVVLKDNICTKGVETTCASKILEGWVPPYSATVVERLQAAGCVIIAKSNLDEFAMGSSTENSAYKLTKNPYDLARVPGGSSGGSAAAVAAEYAPLGFGSDTGGSIRQPASLCGVVGLKPTYGMVSRYGLVAFASSLDQIGPLTKTVRDAALSLSVISGEDPMDSTSLPGKGFSFKEEYLLPEIKGLRIGIVKELTDSASPEVRARTLEAAEALVEAGARVEEVSVPAVTLGLSAYYLIAPAEASSNLARYDGVRYGLRVTGSDVNEMFLNTRAEGFGAEVKRRIMLGTYALSAGYYDAFYGKALKVRTLIVRSFQQTYESYDALLSPVSPSTAFPLGERSADPIAMYLSDICTIPSNLSGDPAISVPYGTDSLGLPIGVQLMAPARGEALLFRVASALEISANSRFQEASLAEEVR